MVARRPLECYAGVMFLPPLTPTFDAAVRDAASASDKFRATAAERLGDCPPGEEARARTALLPLLDDRLGPIRELALEGLAAVATEDDLPALRDRMSDPHSAVRQAAVRAVAAIDPDHSWLEKMLSDEEAELRFQALRSLAEYEPARAKELLPPLLNDPHPGVAQGAATALGDLGATEAADALAGTLGRLDVARSVAVALAVLGDARGERVLIAGLRDRFFALEAAEALGEIASERGCDALAETGARLFASLMLRAATGAALAKRGDPRGQPILARVLQAWRADGRDYAVHAVGELELDGLLPLLARLVERLRGADPRVLARALSRLAPKHQDAQRALDTLQERFGVLTDAAAP